MKSSEPATLGSFHPVLISHILACLPSKALLRCSAFKELKSAIDEDPSFLIKQVKNVPSNHMILTCVCAEAKVQFFYSISLEVSDDSGQEVEVDVRSDATVTPYSRFLMRLEIEFSSYYKMVGSLHGLILIEKILGDHSPTERRSTFLYNPGLGIRKTLPNHPYPSTDHVYDFTSHFGFEPTSNMYTILGIQWDLGELGDGNVDFIGRRPIGCEFKLYRIGFDGEEVSHNWEDIDIEQIPFDILSLRKYFKGEPNLSIHGNLYWLMPLGKTAFIVHFSLLSKTFRTIPLPTRILESTIFHYEGQLGVMSEKGDKIFVFSEDEEGKGKWTDIAVELNSIAAQMAEPKGTINSERRLIPSEFIFDGPYNRYWCILKVGCENKWRKWLKMALPSNLPVKHHLEFETMLYQDILRRL